MSKIIHDLVENFNFSLHSMSALYIVAGSFHFIIPQYYLTILPRWIPSPMFVILVSGAAEIGLGLMLLFDQTRSAAAWSLIVLLICFLPVHIFMLKERESTFKKYPALFLWIRPFIQILLAYWAFLYT
jgi:uncharacterized membrane protein